MARYTEADLSDDTTLILRDGDVLDLSDTKTLVAITTLTLHAGATIIDPKKMMSVDRIVIGDATPKIDLSHLAVNSLAIEPYVTVSGRAKVGEILELQVADVKYTIKVTKLGPQWYQIGDKEVCIEGV